MIRFCHSLARHPFVLLATSPAVGQPKQRILIASVLHEFQPLAVVYRPVCQLKWLQVIRMTRFFIVVSKPAVTAYFHESAIKPDHFRFTIGAR